MVLNTSNKMNLPEPSVSKRSKASLISCFCSSVSSGLPLEVAAFVVLEEVVEAKFPFLIEVLCEKVKTDLQNEVPLFIISGLRPNLFFNCLSRRE